MHGKAPGWPLALSESVGRLAGHFGPSQRGLSEA
jgi:hypothetical protein